MNVIRRTPALPPSIAFSWTLTLVLFHPFALAGGESVAVVSGAKVSIGSRVTLISVPHVFSAETNSPPIQMPTASGSRLASM